MRALHSTVAAATMAAAVQAASLKDIKHIVLFMQENRSFDHYFGTMAGVRGFGDPNVQVNEDGHSVFEQPIDEQNGVSILKPWHINYLGGEWKDATQCMYGGDNSWKTMHTAWNSGQGNNWAAADGADSLGYFTRDDIPTHFDIVEGWTVMDMSSQSLLAATDPNRIIWWSGSVNIPGSPTNADGSGSLILDNNASPGCEDNNLNCFPFVWKTFPEYLEEAGISWQVWQDLDNFEDNMLAYFKQYQDAPEGTFLREKGISFPGLDAFYESAANGTLPHVSWIVGPQEQAEHAPNLVQDGAWLQKKVVDAITSSPAYNETVLIISYDEQGGWADHVLPVVAPQDTPGEWLKDPWGDFGDVPVGPGWRTPRYIISPYTRGGNVFTERADHTSDIMFVEKWAEANGYGSVKCEGITPWRREHMSDLVNALDFANPDYSIPNIADTTEPKPDPDGQYTGNLDLGSLTGPWVGPAECVANHESSQPPVPYGSDNANQDLSLVVEEGFKRVRGGLTEGRYLTFEADGQALSKLNGSSVGLTASSSKHDNIDQRWIVHPLNGPGFDDKFQLQSASNDGYITGFPANGTLTKDAENAQVFAIKYNSDGATYSLTLDQKQARSLQKSSASSVWDTIKNASFEIFSVSYHPANA